MYLEQRLHSMIYQITGHSLPWQIFHSFLESNQIKHILSAPYHPASNGLTERFVQTLKCNLKATVKERKTIHHRLTEFLFEYRGMPNATTNVLPTELFLNKKLKTRFDLMILNAKKHVISKQSDQSNSITNMHDHAHCFLDP